MVDTTFGRAGRGYGSLAIYKALRTEILSLDLAPGQLIDEAGLALRFGVSRSPVREALVRLEGDGLVKSLPNKGTVVAPLNFDEFPVYIDALDLLQRAVTRLAAQLRSEAELDLIEAADARFQDRVLAGDALGMIEENREFHMEIARAGKNRLLAEAYGRILDEGRRPLRLYFRSYGDTLPAELRKVHGRMIAAIRAKDTDAAEQIAREHAEEVHQRFVAYIATRRTDAVGVNAAPRPPVSAARSRLPSNRLP